MAIRSIGNSYELDFYNSCGKRVKKRFKTKIEAIRYQKWYEEQQLKDKEWQPTTNKPKFLHDLISIYHQQYGVHLSSGESRKQKLLNICKKMGYPHTGNFCAQRFNEYRASRINEGVSANTINHDHAYLSAMINELIRLNIWHGINPLDKIRKLKIQELELNYLTTEQIKELFAYLRMSSNKSVYLVSKICLSTGARWGEAQNIKPESVNNGILSISKTKSKKVRYIPISQALEQAIKNHGKIISALDAFRWIIENKISFILPKGQLTHILRHTFASHYIMNGGNILTLQKILGHSDIKTTMRYAHLAPDFMQDVITKNPSLFLDDECKNIQDNNGARGRT